MKSTFGNRLFRLFLILSIIPALILTLFGFYLTLESGHLMDGRTDADEAEVTDYYNDLLFDRIDSALAHFTPLPDTSVPFVDFIAGEDSDGIRILKTGGFLTPEIADNIATSSRDRKHGFVTSNKRIFQYSRLTFDDGRALYAGLIHNPEYTSLLTSVQERRALKSAGQELRPRYVFFLSTLFVGLSFITFVVAYILSARISRGLARPLSELSRAAERISMGDYRQHVQPSGDREIQTLIENFNEMSGRLEQTTARLAQTERVAAWRQVARRFAHELRNPIQPILVSLYRIEKLLSSTDSYSKIEEPLKAASEELNHLRDLADRFSQLAKLPAPSLERTSLNELLASVAGLYKQQLAPFGFELNLPDEDIVANVDRNYLREALLNIIQNAIDASKPGQSIELGLRTGGRRALISLKDSGGGMDQQTVTSARLPYFTTKEKGTGLGLAIVEKSMNEMGGEVYVDSEKGKGTTVILSLPREVIAHEA